MKRTRFFLYSAGFLLLVTGLAKIVSFFGKAKLLNAPDPITGIHFRYLLLLIGMIEISISIFCFFSRRLEFKAMLVAVLATNFALYRLGLYLMHYHSPCACLGGMTDAIGVPSAIADNVMKGVLAYLLIGSYWMLYNCMLKKSLDANTNSQDAMHISETQTGH